GYYVLINGKNKTNYLARTNRNATVGYNFNVVTTNNGIDIVVPNCLQCHAQVFDAQLYIGLGNSMMDFTKKVKSNDFGSKVATKIMKTLSPNQYKAAIPALRAFKA